MRVYVESTIPSYLVARPARDLLQAARQQLTRDWWDLQRIKHELYTSQITLDEIGAGETEMARQRLGIMTGVAVLDLTPKAEAVAETILQSGMLPPNADSDAAHIALATIHGMDILLTWNCRHIANAVIEVQLRRLLQQKGHDLPTIATPEELLGEMYD
jgi:hypothetical protein